MTRQDRFRDTLLISERPEIERLIDEAALPFEVRVTLLGGVGGLVLPSKPQPEASDYVAWCQSLYAQQRESWLLMVRAIARHHKCTSGLVLIDYPGLREVMVGDIKQFLSPVYALSVGKFGASGVRGALKPFGFEVATAVVPPETRIGIDRNV